MISKTTIATVFNCGFTVMAVEFGLIRLVAPILGNSQPVWASVISAIMLALALGNIIGGRLAKQIKLTLLGFLLIVVGITTVGVALFLSHLLLWISEITNRIVSLGALGIVSFWLTLPLGMVTPIFVQSSCSDVGETGKVAGMIQGYSTFGAILGTLVSAFLLIPLFGIFYTLLCCSFLLICNGCWLWKMPKGIIFALFLFTLSPWQISSTLGSLVVEKQSSYADWRVLKSDDGIFWLVSGSSDTVQSYYDPHGKTFSGSWPLMATTPLLIQKENISVASIGVAGGSVLREMGKAFPQAKLTGVEIDSVPVALGKKYLHLPEKYFVAIDDGRYWLRKQNRKFDVILLDAYRSAYIPSHLLTQEFFQLVKEKLAPGGVVALNLLSAKYWLSRGKTSSSGPVVQSCGKTLHTVFSFIHQLEVGNGLNTILIASNHPLKLHLARNLEAPLLQHSLPHWKNYQPFKENNDAYLLTDDHCPVEFLTHLLAYQRIFRSSQ